MMAIMMVNELVELVKKQVPSDSSKSRCGPDALASVGKRPAK